MDSDHFSLQCTYDHKQFGYTHVIEQRWDKKIQAKTSYCPFAWDPSFRHSTLVCTRYATLLEHPIFANPHVCSKQGLQGQQGCTTRVGCPWSTWTLRKDILTHTAWCVCDRRQACALAPASPHKVQPQLGNHHGAVCDLQCVPGCTGCRLGGAGHFGFACGQHAVREQNRTRPGESPASSLWGFFKPLQHW